MLHCNNTFDCHLIRVQCEQGTCKWTVISLPSHHLVLCVCAALMFA